MPTLCYAPFSDLLSDRFCSDAKPLLGFKSYKNIFLHVSGQLYDHQVSYKFSVVKWTWSGIRKKFLFLYKNQICFIFSLNSLEIEDSANIFPLPYRIMSCCLLEIKNSFLPRLLHQSKISCHWPLSDLTDAFVGKFRVVAAGQIGDESIDVWPFGVLPHHPLAIYHSLHPASTRPVSFQQMNFQKVHIQTIKANIG